MGLHSLFSPHKQLQKWQYTLCHPTQHNEYSSAALPLCPAPGSVWLYLKWCILSYWSFLVESQAGLSGSPQLVCLLNGHTERAVCMCQTSVFRVVQGSLWLSGHCGSHSLQPFCPLGWTVNQNIIKTVTWPCLMSNAFDLGITPKDVRHRDASTNCILRLNEGTCFFFFWFGAKKKKKMTSLSFFGENELQKGPFLQNPMCHSNHHIIMFTLLSSPPVLCPVFYLSPLINYRYMTFSILVCYTVTNPQSILIKLMKGRQFLWSSFIAVCYNYS